MSAAGSKNIVIFGGSQYRPGDGPFEDCAALGRAIARQGWTVVNGGYGGTMLASAQGARQEGGEVVGVGCAIFNCPMNECITQPVMTSAIQDRLMGLIDRGDAYVVMPGSTGTLAELALTWELINKRMIPTRPILCWGDFWRPIVEIFGGQDMQDPRINTLGVVERRADLIHFVSTPEQAMEVLKAELGE